MGGINITVGDDYELTGMIQYFEGYMFVTTPKCVAEHGGFPGAICIMNGTGMVDCRKELPGFHDSAAFCATGLGLEDRRQVVKLFNRLGKTRIPTLPSPSGLGCVMIDLVDESGDYRDRDIAEALQHVRGSFVKWCHDNDRFGGLSEHLTQERRCPHVHILYERHAGEHNEFQNYLLSLG